MSSLVRQCLDVETLPQILESRLVDLLKLPSPELEEIGTILSDILGTAQTSFIFVDAIDDCERSERGKILRLLRDVMSLCSSVVKVFLAIRQGMVEEVGNICKSSYQATMSSSEAHLSMDRYIKDVLAERKENGNLVVGNSELLSEISVALTQEANGM